MSSFGILINIIFIVVTVVRLYDVTFTTNSKYFELVMEVLCIAGILLITIINIMNLLGLYEIERLGDRVLSIALLIYLVILLRDIMKKRKKYM